LDLLSLVLIVVAALAAGAFGWFIGTRPAAELRVRLAEAEGAARDRADALARMTPELATLAERAARADGLAQALDDVRNDRDAKRTELATLHEKVANFDEQKRLLAETKEALLKEFQNAGSAVLGKAQEAFLARADERFRQSEEKGEEKLKALLTPVGEKLASYERHVTELEAKRVDAFGQMAGVIEEMRKGQEDVRREAQRLGNSLTNAPKARGRWGERALQNVLEQCGLSQHTDFKLEHSLNTEDGRLRPDAIVYVPGQKMLVIDAKVSLNAYQAAFEADNDIDRKRHLDLHAKSMRNHVQQLGAKSYQSQFEEAPDYVVMFVPGEHFVAAALEHDPELWDFAFKNGVLLATPTNLVAIARTVAQVWRQDKMATEAKEIGRMGAELYGRLKTAADHLKRVGSGLESAVTNYNKFVGSFERNVLTSSRRMAEKGLEISSEIDDVPLIEGAPRYGAADVAAETSEEAAQV